MDIAKTLHDLGEFTGDILFKDAHPIVWQGPVTNWITACDRLLALDVETVVPGHGPLTDLSGLREIRAYLAWLTDQARGRYDAGLDVEDAAREIAAEDSRNWLDSERIYANVHTLYRDFKGEAAAPEVLEIAGPVLAAPARAIDCTVPRSPLHVFSRWSLGVCCKVAGTKREEQLSEWEEWTCNAAALNAFGTLTSTPASRSSRRSSRSHHRSSRRRGLSESRRSASPRPCGRPWTPRGRLPRI